MKRKIGNKQSERAFNVHCMIAKGVVAVLATAAVGSMAMLTSMSKQSKAGNTKIIGFAMDTAEVTVSTVTLEQQTEAASVVSLASTEMSSTCNVGWTTTETPEETSFEWRQTETTMETISVTLEDVDSNPWSTRIGSKYKVSKNDFVELCNLLGREYGADFVSVEEKAKVIQTVMNRVESSHFPDTVEAVIAQPGQYEGYLSRGYYSDKVTESVRQAVLYCLNGYVQNDFVFYWGDGYTNHFYTYENYNYFAQDLNAFKASKIS